MIHILREKTGLAKDGILNHDGCGTFSDAINHHA